MPSVWRGKARKLNAIWRRIEKWVHPKSNRRRPVRNWHDFPLPDERSLVSQLDQTETIPFPHVAVWAGFKTPEADSLGFRFEWTSEALNTQGFLGVGRLSGDGVRVRLCLSDAATRGVDLDRTAKTRCVRCSFVQS
jgi:hypothetical protein